MPETSAEEAVQTAVIVRPSRGRPSGYRPEYCDQVLDYFEFAPQTRNEMVGVQKHANYVNQHGYNAPRMTTGFKREEVRRICAAMPTWERFATSIGVSTFTVRYWRSKYPDFEEACRICEQIQRDFLQQGLLNGSIPPVGGIFVAKNVTQYHDTPLVDRIEHGVTNVPMGVEGERPVLAERTPDELAKLKQLAEEARALGVKLTV
jgi:uncharacterized short protein YbdD (DUF466 family)